MSKEKRGWFRAIMDGYKADIPYLLWFLKHSLVLVVALSAVYLLVRLIIPDTWVATDVFPGPALFP